MRIIAISDTHFPTLPKIPDGDVLVHAGDLTMGGSEAEVMSVLKLIDALPHKHKIVIAGNHDFWFEHDDRRDEMTERFPGIIYLQDESVLIWGVSFYGSPWQPEFNDWAFNVRRGPELAAIWAKIPSDTQVLITHGPPHGILDRCPHGFVGDQDLFDRIKELSDLKLHIFGHIHEGYGELERTGVRYVNASICDERYVQFNEPMVIDLDLTNP